MSENKLFVIVILIVIILLCIFWLELEDDYMHCMFIPLRDK